MLIRVIDLETTGFEPPAGVCEIGWCDLTHDGESWTVGEPRSMLVDPEQPIPPQTSAVHHIVDTDVAGQPVFAEATREALFDEARMRANHFVLVAHNARFERQWLTPEVTGEAHWICTYKAALRLWPEAPDHKNGTLRYWRNPPGLERALAEPAHRAGPDAYVTALVLREMLALASLDDLVLWSAGPALLPRCTFGKHRGEPWSAVPESYLAWVLRQQMDEDVLFTVQREIRLRAVAGR
ncbi:exonuclease domain-containing protein [Methylobacterium pseudosasicola]|uniref:Exodeoxyribonuclease X n=1 Tax=Methylobacterium pseudosasicola TaxID=582667 RepID=A0A1I4V7R3_9HYPH|nr:exonuclease domain-containing protein [Methylobacterium pseudosasicola]SFM97256.1 exodeoxyribonuclease X [Methylobacterium pseudosasicola]